jgi:hypothetical protein
MQPIGWRSGMTERTFCTRTVSSGTPEGGAEPAVDDDEGPASRRWKT